MDILVVQLDDEQRAIATDSDDSRLVLAGPGSGKTRLLTNVAAYQVRKSPAANWRVLCLTFGVEAASEMKRRLADPALGVHGSRRIHVSNFHQLGSHVLHAYADQAGWPRNSQLIGDGADLVADVLGDLRLGAVRVGSVVSALERARNARPVADAPVPAATLQRIADAYEARKLELGVWDYTDLVVRTIELLDVAPRVLDVLRTIYQYIVVDELQDTSGHQLELIARLSNDGETPIFGVADDDQMIYAWRDARPENIVEFQERFRAREEYLVGNYRCPPRIVEAANAIIRPVRPAGVRPAESRVQDRQGQVLIDVAPPGSDYAARVAKLVRAELDSGVAPREIAILAAVSFKFPDLKPALEAAAVPFVHIGDKALAQHPILRLLLAALTCQKQASDDRSLARLSQAVVDTLGLDDDDEIRAMCERLIAPERADRVLAEVIDVLGTPDGDEVEAHIRRIVAVATREGASQSRQHGATSLVIEWYRLDARIRREDESVKLMTTFGAKGLEFDTVVLPYFSDDMVPYAPRGQVPNIAEERRKLYVAITRARRRVVISYAGRPSQFIGDLARVVTPWSLVEMNAT